MTRSVEARVTALETRMRQDQTNAVIDRILSSRDHFPQVQAVLAAMKTAPECPATIDRFWAVMDAAYLVGGNA